MTSPGTVPDTAAVSAASAAAPVYPLTTRLAAEATGTFLLVFAGLGTALFNSSTSAFPVGMAFGVALIAGIIAFGHISGGHFNPAVSLGLAILGKIKWLEMVWYWIVQIVGALLASVVLFAILKVLPAVTGGTSGLTTQKLFDSLANGYGAHSPSQVPLIGVLLVEAVGTAIFVAVVMGATSSKNKTQLAPIGIGLALAMAITVALPLSNGAMNPARATAVVFFADSWAAGQLWLFWVAPLFGGAIAAVIFKAFAPAKAVVLGDVDVEDDDDDDAEEGTIASAGTVTPTLPAPIPATDTKDAQDFFDGPDADRK